jgi:hypothetical protein
VTALRVYRDDGPLAELVARRLARGRPAPERAHAFAWLVPTLLRVLELGSPIALTAAFAPGALPVCFAFLGVVAFHHYDTAYRLRYQRVAPPAWVRLAGGGWDGRTALVCLLALAGVLGPGLLAATVAAGTLFAAESTASWVRFGRAQGRLALADEGDVVE